MNMKCLAGIAYLITCTTFVTAQKPLSGSYTYSILWDEFQGKDLRNTCTVIIDKDSVKIIHNGKANLTGKKGDVLYQGIILKHKTGKWIIGQSSKDKNAKEIGGCGDGPPIINFKRKFVRLC